MPETLRNEIVSLSVDLSGGAITDFHLLNNKVNPLQFSFTPEQMPENNKKGAAYKGHFLCLGRWGEPSKGEIKAGVPNHGDFANINWEKIPTAKKLALEMTATSEIEGLAVQRSITMDEQNPIYTVEETVSNINPIGRPFNIVQHPTFAFPFLDEDTFVDCNGSRGFNQKFYQFPEKFESEWPLGFYGENISISLRNPHHPGNAIFSYIINSSEKLGWVTCFSPKYRILIGYVWKREDFPWLHFWLHWEGGKLQYRGVEFGTAGIHQPFQKILQIPKIFEEKTLAYIDAGENIKFSYTSFISHIKGDFHGVKKVECKDGELIIHPKNGQQPIIFYR